MLKQCELILSSIKKKFCFELILNTMLIVRIDHDKLIFCHEPLDILKFTDISMNDHNKPLKLNAGIE